MQGAKQLLEEFLRTADLGAKGNLDTSLYDLCSPRLLNGCVNIEFYYNYSFLEYTE